MKLNLETIFEDLTSRFDRYGMLRGGLYENTGDIKIQKNE
jgi:hypothetical protein